MFKIDIFKNGNSEELHIILSTVQENAQILRGYYSFLVFADS